MKKFFLSQLDRINDYYSITKKDPKEFTSFKAGALKVNLYWYEVEGLGNLCFLEAKAMFGLMKMYTMVITPNKKDVPIYSFDYIKAMNKHTLLLEEYDVELEKSQELNKLFNVQKEIIKKYEYLENKDLGTHWYDNIKFKTSLAKISKNKQTLINLASEYLDSYINYSINEKVCDIINKNKKCSEYVDGLFENGGPSTDAFKKAIGEEKTKKLFYNIVFGVNK